MLQSHLLDTPLGPMLAVADEKVLYLLEFVDRPGLECEIEMLRKKLTSLIVPGKTAPIDSIEKELQQYFKAELSHFQTPIQLLGSSFQREVWRELQKIPLGQTRSYSEIARAIKKPSAVRAGANANGANQLAIIVPCHRVIRANGDLGGYGGGIAKKEWLLFHERARI